MNKFLPFLIICIFLVGCSSQATNGEDSSKIDTSYADDYASNPQVTDDRTLLKVEDSVIDEKGEATVKKLTFPNETYEMDPVKLHIKDVKLIHLKPDYSLIDYFHMLTHEEEFDVVKLFVEIENTSNEPLNYAPIAMLETNTGEIFDWEKDIYLEGLNGEIEGNETKSGNLGFIVDSSKELEWIEITTSDVYDKNQNKIKESEKIKIEL
ncbi:putative periplasmic lipoprotein [Metabacillus schmidteae]|uniref:hypothetical protein n=1 Tax=Metabacillus schmidteae TaxID=2730405 RepID=UPI00158BA1BC|nr:hypothetical protein [Metabacillus schmidteae]